MMGTHQPQKELFSYQVDLDKRVRADHPLRRVKQLVDFSFVRAEVADRYGYNGHESVDPEILVKMMFLLFYDDIASERELVGQIAERLDYLWFLGYGLDDTIPNHSVLSKARARWGREVFEQLFVRSVSQCVAAGLVEGKKIHLDSSLVDANASNNSALKSSAELIAALKAAYGAQEQKLQEKTLVALPCAGNPSPVATEKSGGVNATLMSTTDPDATVARSGKGEAPLRYKNHRAVDDAHGVITAVETTAGHVDEGQRLIPLVEQHQANTETAVAVAVADSKYGTVDNFRQCQQRGIRPHMADLQSKQAGSGRRAGIFAQDAFHYDSATDTYRCPAGQTLQRHHWNATRNVWEYRAPQGVCAGCALRARCTRAKDGRTLRRHESHELIQRARQQSQSAAARTDRRRRRYLMEGNFADAANNHGFKRSRWRRLWRQQIQDWMIAAIQNIRILARHTDLRPAQSAAARLAPNVSQCRLAQNHLSLAISLHHDKRPLLFSLN